MQAAHAFDWVDYGDSGIVHPVNKVIAGMDFGLPEVEVLPVSFRMLPGTGIGNTDWLELATRIAELSADGALDGIVVTHGTATLEETAFFLSVTLEPVLPVVVTGAQRPPNAASSDAVAGLRQALIAASQAPAGVWVAMNGMVFAPDDVTKTANHALDAFEAPEFGPLGRIEASGNLTLRRAPIPLRRIFDLSGQDARKLPRVDLVMSYAGADGAAVDALAGAGAQGLISVGMPPGRCTPSERAALLRAVEAGVTVVQSSRAARGQVPLQQYNARDGILSGGGLAPNKARILVMLALATGTGSEELQDLLLGW